MELLNKTYVYVNSNTNEVSKKPLTISQLCRIISSTTSNSASTSTSSTSASNKPINCNTYIIGYNISTNEYDTIIGWKIIKTIPILREVCIPHWYYESLFSDDDDDDDDGDDDDGNNDKNTKSNSIKGPIDILQMAKLYYGGTTTTTTAADDSSVQRRTIITDNTRVWCSELSSFVNHDSNETNNSNSNSSSEWKKLSELPYLLLAIEAFRNQTTLQTSSSITTTTIDSSAMVYDNGSASSIEDDNDNKVAEQQKQDLNQEEQAELELFLTSVKRKDGNDYDEEEEEGFESDGGTAYVKDNTSDQWIKKMSKTSDATTPITESSSSSLANNNNTVLESAKNCNKRKKRKKAQFAVKNARNWIYISNLPKDTTKDEIHKYFSRAGILDLDPNTQTPKIKLYTCKEEGPTKGLLKGDASLCYAYPESVDIALQVLDETYLRADDDCNNMDCKPLSVIRAKFEKKKDADGSGTSSDLYNNKNTISNKKRQIAKLAARQAVDWDDTSTNGRIGGGRKGLRIIILKHMFNFNSKNSSTSENNNDFIQLEKDTYDKCSAYGNVEKITICTKHIDSIVIVKFTQPHSASSALDYYNNSMQQGKAIFWDGVTDYTNSSSSDVLHMEKKQKDEENRLDEFGDWLENQVVPDEFLPRHE